ncbi:MAG: hypothetical protein ACJ75T_11675 [Solirubrobacterales bacterium]
MPAKTRFVLIALALALAVLAGCGGGSEGGSTSISQEQFVRQGDKICREVFAKIERRYNKLSGFVAARTGPDDPREGQMNKGTQRFVVPALEELALRLRAMGAPAEQAQGFAKTLAALEAEIGRAAKDPGAARESSVAGSELLLPLGLEDCQ